MPTKSLDQKKRQQVLLIIAGGIAIITVVVLYFGVFKTSKPITIKEDTRTERSLIVLDEKLKKIELDFEFLNETILPFLNRHGQVLEQGETKRENPFIPH